MPYASPGFSSLLAVSASLLWLATPAAAWSLAAGPGAQPGHASRTATFRAVTGEVAIEDSTGQLRIEAWDEPDVRLTVEKHSLGGARANRRDMEAVRVWTTRTAEGGLRVTTESGEGGAAGVNVSYSLRVPRGLALRVRHETGTVNIHGVMGRIQAMVEAGALNVRLVDNEPVKLDARVREGKVRSSLPVVAMRRDNAAPARLLYLRVGTGDIDVHRDTPYDEFAVPVELID